MEAPRCRGVLVPPTKPWASRGASWALPPPLTLLRGGGGTNAAAVVAMAVKQGSGALLYAGPSTLAAAPSLATTPAGLVAQEEEERRERGGQGDQQWSEWQERGREQGQEEAEEGWGNDSGTGCGNNSNPRVVVRASWSAAGMVEPIADADFAPCLSLVQDLELIGRPASSSVCPAVTL